MVKIRQIEESDLEQLQLWRNSESVMPYCRQHRQLSQDDMLTWYDSVNKDELFIITDELPHDNPIGVGGLVRIDWRNRKGELSFYVGVDKCRTQETVSEALLLLMEYAFKTLGLHKVYFPCYSFNPYISLYEKILKREYVAKEEYYWKGKFWDRIILVKYEHI